MVNGKVNNGKMDVPSVLLVPVAVTKANIKDTVVADGFWKAARHLHRRLRRSLHRCRAISGGGGSTRRRRRAGKIAILLPETKTARYETQDLPQLQGQAASAGL